MPWAPRQTSRTLNISSRPAARTLNSRHWCWRHTDAFTQTLLKRLAMQLDGYHGLTAREMSVLLNLDLVKGNAAHAAKVKSRVWKAWHKNKQKAGQYSSQAGQQAMQVELPG